MPNFPKLRWSNRIHLFPQAWQSDGLFPHYWPWSGHLQVASSLLHLKHHHHPDQPLPCLHLHQHSGRALWNPWVQPVSIGEEPEMYDCFFNADPNEARCGVTFPTAWFTRTGSISSSTQCSRYRDQSKRSLTSDLRTKSSHTRIR